ncbi:hypothetical protein ACHAW5_003863 [Stephanodiscus triporus]|uniref:Mannosylglycerate hydrolase MGH1-like glycoside hydrolase domain-containing protein n=1 Tax=Stephanodiscus triporus TaxID=2934178 RepID=A0ABD3P4Q8_9STRA
MIRQRRPSGRKVSETTTPLDVAARSILLSSIRTIGDGANRLIYPSDDGVVDGVVETTTTLVAARALSKLGRSDLAWDFLRTLFGAQGSDGFLPKFVYLNRTAAIDDDDDDDDGGGGGDGGSTTVLEGAGWHEFVGARPGPRLFPHAPKGRAPPSPIGGSDVRVWSSNTISASPHHSTSVLDIFYLSNQTEADVGMLIYFHGRLQKWHDFLHDRIISNCSASTAAYGPRVVDPAPCLAVRHPWETEIEMTSPLWKIALENVTKVVADAGWTPKFDVPASVKSAFDYPGDRTYNALLYLLESLSDRSEIVAGLLANDERPFSLFQMVDVGFTSALAKADRDLHEIGQILSDKHVIAQPSRYAMDVATGRSHRSEGMLHRMWDDDRGAFFNAILNRTFDGGAAHSSNYTTSFTLPLGSTFDALWAPLSNSTMVEQMSSHLLQRSGQYSFYCGDYPLWSLGGCDESDKSALILFLLNYRVAKGLRHNKEVGLAHFLESSSLNLICGLPNSDESDLTNCNKSQRLAWAFNATSELPLGGLTSTLTAAIVLDFLHPDKIFKYESGPPISSSSVIVLIAMELVVAFGIGLTCLLLSLNLMRRATADEDGDAFVQIIRERQPDMELLVQSPAEDTGNMNDNYEAVNDPSPWSLGFISGFIPLTFWRSNN